MTSAAPRPQQLEAALAGLRETLERTPAAAEEVATQAAIQAVEQRWRDKLRKFAFVSAGLFTLVAVAMLATSTALFGQIADQARKDAVRDALISRNEETIAAFKAQLDAANIQLKAQGLPTVPAPPDPAPGTPEQAQLITAAGTAATLATLPKEVLEEPSPQALAKAVADYVALNPGVFTPSPQAIIDGVASYFAQNPLPEPKQGETGPKGDPGEQGPMGPAGPPPTAEQIRAAFRDEVNANPQVLCPLGGIFGPRRVALADGGSITQYGCFQDDPPPADGGDAGSEPGNSTGDGAATPPVDQNGGSPASTTAPAPPPPTTEVPAPPPASPPATDDSGPLPLMLGSTP